MGQISQKIDSGVDIFVERCSLPSVVAQAIEYARDINRTREAHFTTQALRQIAETDVLDFFAERIDTFHNRRLRRFAIRIVVACGILAEIQQHEPGTESLLLIHKRTRLGRIGDEETDLQQCIARDFHFHLALHSRCRAK